MNIMKQLFLTFSIAIFILTSCQENPIPSPMETKIEDGYKYTGYKNDSIPKKEGNIMNIPRKKDNTEFAEFRLIGVWKEEKTGEITNVIYQDIITGHSYNTGSSVSSFFKNNLVSFWNQYEPGDIVKIPAVRTEIYGEEAFDIDLTRIINKNK